MRQSEANCIAYSLKEYIGYTIGLETKDKVTESNLEEIIYEAATCEHSINAVALRLGKSEITENDEHGYVLKTTSVLTSFIPFSEIQHIDILYKTEPEEVDEEP